MAPTPPQFPGMLRPADQISISVTNIDSAMKSMAAAFGVVWAEPVCRKIGDSTVRVTFARTEPPHLELIEGFPGERRASDTAPSEPSLIHHVGMWSHDLERDGDALVGSGLRLEYDLGHARFYIDPRLGTRIELIDERRRDEFLARWRLAG